MYKHDRKDHDAMRRSVCCCCLRPGCQRRVQDSQIEMISKILQIDFKLDDESLPYGLCESCRNRVARGETGFSSHEYDKLLENFRCLKKPGSVCPCYICKNGRSKTFPRSRTNKAKKLEPVSKCSKCFATLAPGKVHDCKLSNRVDNVLSWLPKNVSEQVASTVIGDQVNNNGDKIVTLKRKKGPSLTLDLQPAAKKIRLSHESMDKFRVNLNLTDRETRQLAKGLRVAACDRDIIEPGYDNHLAAVSKEEEQFLTLSRIHLENQGSVHEVVHSIDLQTQLDHLKSKRKIFNDDDCLVEIHGDTGGDFFKVYIL